MIQTTDCYQYTLFSHYTMLLHSTSKLRAVLVQNLIVTKIRKKKQMAANISVSTTAGESDCSPATVNVPAPTETNSTRSVISAQVSQESNNTASKVIWRLSKFTCTCAIGMPRALSTGCSPRFHTISPVLQLWIDVHFAKYVRFSAFSSILLNCDSSFQTYHISNPCTENLYNQSVRSATENSTGAECGDQR